MHRHVADKESSKLNVSIRKYGFFLNAARQLNKCNYKVGNVQLLMQESGARRGRTLTATLLSHGKRESLAYYFIYLRFIILPRHFQINTYTLPGSIGT